MTPEEEAAYMQRLQEIATKWRFFGIIERICQCQKATCYFCFHKFQQKQAQRWKDA